MQIPFNHQFKDKVIVITGAGGVLCGFLSKQLAKQALKSPY